MGTWSAGGNLNTSRWSLRACGLQTAGLALGGRNGGIHRTTEEYNGTAWSVGGDLLHKRQLHGACGIQAAGLGFGGSDGVTYLKSTEEYNGTAWSAGGDLPATVANHGACGTQSAGLSFGGSQGAVTNEYNGTAWFAGGLLNKARWYLAGCGTQSAGLSIGGYDSINYLANTEEYNGTAWSPGGDLILARGDLAACGLQTAGLSFGGYIKYSLVKNTEEYDGAAWSVGGDMITATRWHAGCGTLVAGLSVITNRTEEYTGTAPPVQAKSIARSKTALTDIWIRSLTTLFEPALTDRIPSFWFLHSMSGIPGSGTIPPTDTPTLYKVPFYGLPVTLDLYFGVSTQKYHSFTFDENVDAYNLWGTYTFQHEKCWAYDQHNNHLAILAKVQKAVHVYDLNSKVEDIIFSLQADEFANAVGLTFSDGQIDVFIPTVTSSGSTPGYCFLFDLTSRGSGGYLPNVYSFNIDGTPVDGPVLYSKGAVESKTYFGVFTVVSPVVLSKLALENPVFIPAWSKLTFVEDQYAKSKTFLDDEDFVASECDLRIWGSEGCNSKSHLNVLNPDYHPRSKTSFASPYEWGLQARVTAIGDYLLVGLMSNIYLGSLEDSNASLYLVLFDRNTRKCIWSKTLKVSRVTGTTLYDGWLWEDIKAKSGFNCIFSEGKFEIELFDCFGTARIGLARYGTLDSPSTTKGAVWEEYDINLENPRNINLVKDTTSSLLYPTGFIFKARDPYDFPIKTGEPKKDYLCYTMRSESDLSADGVVELFQRDKADADYVFAGSTPSYGSYAWLVALLDEANCPFIKSATDLNIDFSSIPSKALLRIANPCIGTSGVLGQVDLEESLIKIIQSKTAFDDSGLVQSKVFMDDFLVKSSTAFIDNKNLAFPGRFVIGSSHLSTGPTDDPGGPGIRPSVIAIVRIGDDDKAYHCMTCKVWSGVQALLWCRPAIVGNYAYYIVREMLHNVNGPPWDLPHYFLWKVHLATYEGTHKLPVKLYYEGTGVWPDVDFYSVDYLIELGHPPLGGESEGQPIVYLHGRLFYVYNDSGVYGIAYIWLDPFVQGAYKVSEILPGFTEIVSIDTDGTHLYVLGYKSDIEGLWLIKLTVGLAKLDELVIFKGKLHVGSSYNAQFTFWDNVNNQFIIGIAPVAGRRDIDLGYGAIVYSPVDGSIKWWKNFYPLGIAVHTLPGLNTTYFQRKRDATIGMYTTHGDYKGVDLDISDLSGGSPFDMRSAQVKEVGVETSVQSKVCLLRSAEEQDNLFPDIPGPTQVPREQRFLV